jgi:hypothetical protein
MARSRTIPALFAAVSLGVLSLGIGACATTPSAPEFVEPPPTAEASIEIRHNAPAVHGNQFTCAGIWPTEWSPCSNPPKPEPVTLARSSDEPDAIELLLFGWHGFDDGPETAVLVKLTFAGDELIAASAEEQSTEAVSGKIVETTSAISGFVDPEVAGLAPDARHAGKFWLIFPFGSFRGNYDSAQGFPH